MVVIDLIDADTQIMTPNDIFHKQSPRREKLGSEQLITGQSTKRMATNTCIWWRIQSSTITT
jgi:hypothetical protein